MSRDRIAGLDGKLEKGQIDPQSAKVIADNLNWLASKDAPDSLSDRVELTGEQGKDLFPEKESDDLELARFIAFILSKAASQRDGPGGELAEFRPLLDSRLDHEQLPR